MWHFGMNPPNFNSDGRHKSKILNRRGKSVGDSDGKTGCLPILKLMIPCFLVPAGDPETDQDHPY